VNCDAASFATNVTADATDASAFRTNVTGRMIPRPNLAIYDHPSSGTRMPLRVRRHSRPSRFILAAAPATALPTIC
jgi:hypothetical protein